MIKKITIIIRDEEDLTIECGISESILEKIKNGENGSCHLVMINKDLK